MTRIKLCGIRDYDTAKLCIDCGVHSIGFVFYKKSPRYIEIDRCIEIISKLPPFVGLVGVFSEESLDEIIRIILITGINCVQLHGNYNENDVSVLKRLVNIPITISLRINTLTNDIINHNYWKIANAVIIDKFDNDNYGGTGESFIINNDLSVELSELISRKGILAGGINIDNLEYYLSFKPYAIDISSGIEIEKGVKSKDKIVTLMKKFYNLKI